MGRKKKVTEEARRLLGVVWEAQKEIDRLNNLKEKLKSQAEKVTTTYSDMPPGGHNPSSRSDTYDKLIDTENKIGEAVHRWCNAIAEVQTVLSWVEDGRERLVLEYRYVNCEDWITISFRLNYSVQHIYRIHGVALYKLAMMLKKDERK